MSNMRGLDTQVRAIRRRVFKEVAKLGFECENLAQGLTDPAGRYGSHSV